MAYKPSKEEIKRIYRAIYEDPRTKVIYEEYEKTLKSSEKRLRKSEFVQKMMGDSCGESYKTVEKWIYGVRNCQYACWRCLVMDFKGVL